MRCKLKRLGPISLSMKNRNLDECGNADITNSQNKFVDPALKFFHGVPLMMNTNERIDEQLANGTFCIGLYIKLKPGCVFHKEIWEGYIVNTVYANEIDHILCKKYKNDLTDPEYFTVKPEEYLCSIKLGQLKKMQMEKI